MAFAGHAGLGATAAFATPAALRLKYFGTGDGVHWMYPGDLVSRIPDNADWLPNITGIGGQGQIHGFVGPIITTPGVTANGGQGYAYDASGNMLFWDANGHLVTQQNLPASSGAAVFATSAADAYNPASPHFGLTIANADKSFTQFEPTEAVSVAGRMASLGEDLATATARAQAAAQRLGVAVVPVSNGTAAGPASSVAQWQSQVSAANGNIKSDIAGFPLSTQILSDAVTQLGLSGPGVPDLVSSVMPTLETTRQGYVSQLTALAAQWAATWAADVQAVPSTDPTGAKVAADVQAGQQAVASAILHAASALSSQAISLLQQGGGQASAATQGASSGTTNTTSSTGGTTQATVDHTASAAPTPVSSVTNADGSVTTTYSDGSTTTTSPTGAVTATTPATAGFTGSVAMLGIAAVVGAILLMKPKRGGPRR